MAVIADDRGLCRIDVRAVYLYCPVTDRGDGCFFPWRQLDAVADGGWSDAGQHPGWTFGGLALAVDADLYVPGDRLLCGIVQLDQPFDGTG
ncbi:hypothetical protein D3C87_1697370 [compost metagenome]